MARFAPLFSGSSGNSTFFGSATEGILIDAGMNAKQLTLALDRVGVDPKTLRGIFITHEHSDHISGLRVFASKNGLPVWATKGTINYLEKHGHLTGVGETEILPADGVSFDTMRITPFRTSHDAAESVGYRVEFADGRIAALATDTGIATPEVLHGVRGADLVLLESNHDVRMLRNGPYPYPLQQRILSRLGHLSNTDCAAVAVNLLEHGTTRFILGHLSRQNNTPEEARRVTLNALTGEGGEEGEDFLLSVAPPAGGEMTVF
ncbi:MAG: MBL fold metallo-hydrolase [Clostridia bacterium]|nr:MBL fold metallo-hydrolase [Clostridia bacterium]